MNGAHDLGGTQSIGAINPEAETEEPLFHSEWERRAFAVTVATGALGQWSIDRSRFARERQHPVDYLRNSYYENWMAGLETLLLEAGLVTAEELKAGKSMTSEKPAASQNCLTLEKLESVLKAGSPADRPESTPPRFTVGDRVRVKLVNPKGHIRSPRYVRGHVGVVQEFYGSHIFPDRSAEGDIFGAPLYNVRFEGRDLWGDSAESQALYIDLWDSYLDPA